MIVVLLIKKTTALFLIMCMGMLLVKKGILNAGDSRVISAISIHLILPCVILNAFQVEFSPEVKEGLFLSLAASRNYKCGADCACKQYFQEYCGWMR